MKYSIIDGGETAKFYTSDEQTSNGCIGHMRFDFGDGYEFWQTWWPRTENEEYNTDVFKAEYSDLLKFLRAGILKSAGDASKQIRKLGLTPIDDDRRYYGCHVLTEQHAYYLRLSTSKGDYCYIYCYLCNGC